MKIQKSWSKMTIEEKLGFLHQDIRRVYLKHSKDAEELRKEMDEIRQVLVRVPLNPLRAVSSDAARLTGEDAPIKVPYLLR